MAKANNSTNAAIVTIAKDHAANAGDVIKLSTGILARVLPVSPNLVDEAMASVEDPPIPVVKKEDGTEYENPDHPAYERALAKANKQREQAAMDALVMFGVTLVDADGNEIGAPEDNEWVEKLQFLARRGRLDLAGIDFTNELDRDFMYKRHVAIAAMDIMAITKRSGLREEDVQRALNSFPDNA